MVSEVWHIFNNKIKFIAPLAVLLVIGLVRVYFNNINNEDAGLIMYTSHAPAGISVTHDNILSSSTTDILIDKGDDLATKKFIRQFSIIDKVESVSGPINVRPSEGEANFKIGTPIEVSYKINSNNIPNNLHIIYHSQTSDNISVIGVLSKRSYTIKDGVITFKTRHFGNYQFVTLSPQLETNHMRSTKKSVFNSLNNKHQILYANWK